MNYRTLFIISFLTLAIGIGGILFLPTDGDNVQNVDGSGQINTDTKPKKQIVIVELKKIFRKERFYNRMIMSLVRLAWRKTIRS